MGFRFRRSLRIMPGVKVNIGKSGFTSVSVGGRGLTTNFGKKGTKTTVSIPGTGLSYTTSPNKNTAAPASNKVQGNKGRVVQAIIIAVVIGLFIMSHVH